MEQGGVGKVFKFNHVVTMFNDIKKFCCLDLKDYFIFCFKSNYTQICLNLYATLFMT